MPITGLAYLDGRQVQPAALRRMTTALAGRGKESSGIWTGGPAGNIGLGWCRSRSLVTVTVAAGGLSITADARLDNRDELIASLGVSAAGEPSDGELILGAYARWGDECSARLLGDFSFAIWDERRRRLFCARDHFGVRPFHYFLSDRLFAFGSEIKALLELPEVPRRLDEARVGDYLAPLLEDKESTFYQDIRRLPPACSLAVAIGKVSRTRYWIPDNAPDIRLRSDGAYAAAFRDRFTEAVRCRLRGASPIGSTLTGGLDSSSIVCVARELLRETGREPLSPYSVVFESADCDERAYMRAVVEQDASGVDACFLPGDRVGPLDDLTEIRRFEDEAFYGPYAFLHLAIYRAAARRGVGVLLQGLDGDTTVSHGLAHLCALLRTGRWMRLAAEVGGLSRHFQCSRWGVLRRHALVPLLPRVARATWSRVRGRGSPDAGLGVINPDFARRIGLPERLKVFERRRLALARRSRTDHCARLDTGLIPLELEVAGRAAGSFGLECRYPFLDRRLVEFCVGLPPEQKIRRGWTRVVMRRALEGSLPADVRRRSGKTRLGSELVRRLALDDGRIAGVLRDSSAVRPFVNVGELGRTYDRCRNGEATLREAYGLWNVVTLGLWLETSPVG